MSSGIPLFRSFWLEQEVPTFLFEARLADETNPLSPSERAEALTQLARCQGLSSEFEKAHATLDSIPEAVRPAGSTASTRWLLEKGRVLRSSGKDSDPETKACFLAAYNEAAEDFFKVDAAHMLAILDPKETPEGTSAPETWTTLALKLTRASTNPNTQTWATSLLNNAGMDAMEAGRPQDALDMFIEARELRKLEFEKKPSEYNTRTYRMSRWSVARALRECGRNEEAYKIQCELSGEAESAFIRAELEALRHLLGIEKVA
ncbi:hypothetical protein FB45DRAFT_182920 [Roridomyces roridus]|uniref:Uncharacterized protein n=1 Tax=Roridomyces roridus TaxID=1738132 RepID=A0AAD7CEE2_9AGAR|nr:hypothetical protein FB45DRAFT_182920 [Roridomyces roridus]